MARALYILVYILLFPFMVANLAGCLWSTMIVMGIADASDATPLPTLIVWLLIGYFFWSGAAATCRALGGEAPLWLRVVWLPGLIGNIAAVYLSLISIVLRTDEFSLALFSPGVLARLSGLQVFAVVVGTVGIVASVVALGWLERWRRAMAPANDARLVDHGR